eukprot:TRINITY_DN33865_c0_g1_i1.p1 TRINITY_DN33865_c0_g1~~TRINITY_DN33865_c0_g1_i1.p1  ORF type:complete len:348 (+),score=60.89 TRINITY_DN33865_c0_g1_i1:49-1092(+)
MTSLPGYFAEYALGVVLPQGSSSKRGSGPRRRQTRAIFSAGSLVLAGYSIATRWCSDSMAAPWIPVGMELWRSMDTEEPTQQMLRSPQNDIVMEELDPTPYRRLACLPLPLVATPCVGQVSRVVMKQASDQFEAVKHALRNGGVVGCVPEILNSQVLPRGLVVAEIVGVTGIEEGSRHVTVGLRGVGCLRVIEREATPVNGTLVVPLVQEVMEWTKYEDENGGENGILEELKLLRELYGRCGDLQNKTGIKAAGDFTSYSLDELTEKASRVLKGVKLCGIEDSNSSWQAAAQRKASIATHCAIGSLSAASTGKRANFLCDPSSVLYRIKRLNAFLKTMESLLTGKLK